MYYFKGLTFIQFRIQYTEQNPYVLFHHQFLVGGAGRGGDADDVGAGRQRRDVEGGGEAVDGGAQMALVRRWLLPLRSSSSTSPMRNDEATVTLPLAGLGIR